jgi:hypothetical protein
MRPPAYGKDPLDHIVGACRAKEKDLSERHDETIYGA